MLGYGFLVVFKIDYDFERLPDGGERKVRHCCVNKSVGIACGMLLAALRNAGLAALMRTPNQMGLLNEILKRPKNEKLYLLMPVHNLLFASLDDVSGRWPPPHNRSLIRETEERPPAKDSRGGGVHSDRSR